MHRLTNGQVARSKVRSGKSLVLISTWAADLQISTADSVQRGILSRKKIVDIKLNLITLISRLRQLEDLQISIAVSVARGIPSGKKG